MLLGSIVPNEWENPNPPFPATDLLDDIVGVGDELQTIPLSKTPLPGLVNRTTAVPTFPFP
jgi:hypothetical protein